MSVHNSGQWNVFMCARMAASDRWWVGGAGWGGDPVFCPCSSEFELVVSGGDLLKLSGCKWT